LGVVRPAALVPLLHDDSAAVTRQVVATLRRNVDAIDPDELRGLLGMVNPSHVRFAGYRLLTGGGAWQRLVTDLELIDDTDERLRVTSRADLATWLEHQAATTYHGPSRERAAQLDRLIEQARPIVGEGRARLLRFHAGLATGG
jgi:hypothetical protein